MDSPDLFQSRLTSTAAFRLASEACWNQQRDNPLFLVSTLAVLSAIVALTLAARCLGYVKRALASRMLRSFRRIIDAETRLAEFERELEQAIDIDDCWARLRVGSLEFGFNGVRMAIDGAVFAETVPPDSERLWQLRIPLKEGRYIDFFRELSCLDPPISSTFASAIERSLNGWFATREPELSRQCMDVQEYFTASAGGNGGAR